MKSLDLLKDFSGDIHTDINTLIAYQTDASAYSQRPLAVVYPRSEKDIEILINWAQSQRISLIARGAGTSLAGQVVGKGVIVDVSRYMNKVIEVNAQEQYAWVEPGVVLEQLNQYLKPYRLFFAPETSTANRCTIGGMVGNNACGAHSLIYGSTLDHLIEVKGYLSNGEYVHFKPLTNDEFNQKLKLSNLEGKIYQQVYQLLSQPQIQRQLIDNYPDPSLKRRNTGYAIDQLLYNTVFGQGDEPFNFCKLIAGSEGTLMFVTRVKLNLLPLEDKETGLLCAHFHTLEEAIQANLVALTFQPDAIELIDQTIVACTKNNIEQQKNRFFIQGEPGAILLIEFSASSREDVVRKTNELSLRLQHEKLGYAFPLYFYPEISRIWELRRAALGVLTNIPGDAKPVSLVEDNAVPVQHLLDYVTEFKALLQQYKLDCVFHAHIATGELHTRPVINLKTEEGQKLFRIIGTETAYLVKKYRGSISGEHGDGRLRSEFIPIIIGSENYQLCKLLKNTWDPNDIFNPGIIVNPVRMDENLRYAANTQTPDFDTYFDFSSTLGFLRHIEQCNGSADCRKLSGMGGIMCPSYRATQNEKMTTRARANVMRELFHNQHENAFNSTEVLDILHECLSCKGCKSECPSNVDMTKLKAEFLQHYYDKNGVPLRSLLFAYLPVIYRIGSASPFIFNILSTSWLTRPILRKIGIAPERQLPQLARVPFGKWYRKFSKKRTTLHQPTVWLFVDEFTYYLEPQLAQYAIEVLEAIGERLEILPFHTSTRTYLSKGLVKKAASLIQDNLKILKEIWNGEPIVGIEPSAILTLRDEYIDLTRGDMQQFARKLKSQVYLIEEYLAKVVLEKPQIKQKFCADSKMIYVHAHCYQKSLSNPNVIGQMLAIPENYTIQVLKTDCCGMAGSFGYEAEHYKLSMQIGELSLFPQVRMHKNDCIAVPGTSCRQQIYDATGIKTFHPIEILRNALSGVTNVT
ncbi:MAG TPA: FAD-linked oxidase C-terminal domain-containing protein [Bacteroidales bacterium]|nr:FAD-linked oxidase C-terminal domain-containing protein [Bacteroidales bacterium]HPO64885.1 FAD-linked oxidase C-terminal domain-containing protein [Bacteroidales bacterium]